MTQNHYYDLFIKDLTVSTCIGVNENEQGAPQRLVITIHMLAHDECAGSDDQLARVVCYNSVVEDMHQLIARRAQHGLLETLAAEMMAHILQDERIVAVRLCLQKPDVRQDSGAVGIQCYRVKPHVDEALCHRLWASHRG